MPKPGDWVTIKYGEQKGLCAKITGRKKSGEYGVIPCRIISDANDLPTTQPGSMIYMDEEALTPIAPYVITQKQLRQLVRAEISYRDFADAVYPPFNIKAARRYTIKIEDIQAALTNINENKAPLAIFKLWFWMILNVFHDSLHIKERYDENMFTDFPKEENEIFSTVYGLTEKLYWRLEERLGSREDTEQYLIHFDEEPDWDGDRDETDEIELSAYYAVCMDIMGRIRSYLTNAGKPQGQWIYSSSQMRHVIGAYENDSDLRDATPEALALYREFVRRLYAEGDLQAIKILAWGHYFGGIAYRQNYELARIYLQELFDRTGDSYAAHALGKIYYYGYTNKGIPQYEKAFPLFSYGVLDAIEESVYMAADMLIHGHGTVKNLDMGLNLLIDGYKNAIFEFCHGEYGCKFAEYALYMGDACTEGLIYGMTTKDTYRFYLEAEYAARKRKKTDFPVEKRLVERIERALEEIRERVGLDMTKTELKADFPIYLPQMYEDRMPVKVSLFKKRGAQAYTLKVSKFDLRELFKQLHIPIIPEKTEEEGKGDGIPQLLMTLPELSWTGLVTEIEYTLENCTILKQPDKPGAFLSDGFHRDENTNAVEFYAHGEVLAAFEADKFVVSIRKKKRK